MLVGLYAAQQPTKKPRATVCVCTSQVVCSGERSLIDSTQNRSGGAAPACTPTATPPGCRYTRTHCCLPDCPSSLWHRKNRSGATKAVVRKRCVSVMCTLTVCMVCVQSRDTCDHRSAKSREDGGTVSEEAAFRHVASRSCWLLLVCVLSWRVDVL